MTIDRFLTKSRFKLAVECPTKLFFVGKDKVFRNLKKENSFMDALAQGGFQVGAAAAMLFPDGIHIKESDNSQSLTRTQELLSKNKDITLFEATFAFEGLLAKIDILVKKGDRLELIEVKAKSYDSLNPKIAGARTPILGGMRPYIEDIAFQKLVVTKAFPGYEVQCFLMMPDKSVAATLDGLNQCFKIKKLNGLTQIISSPEATSKVDRNKNLLAKVAVDEYVEIVMKRPLEFPGSGGGAEDHLPEVVKRWADLYEMDELIDTAPHKGCAGCEFREIKGGVLKSGYHKCLTKAWGLKADEIDGGTVLDIWNYRRKDHLLANGIIRLSQVNEDDIKIKVHEGGLSNSERQWLQVKGIPPSDDKGGFYFDADVMRGHMKAWRYPLHMIDFETCTVALPFFSEMRPYESVAFQFSHHVIYEDGRIKHKNQALISDPGKFPNFDFVRELMNALKDDNGTIFRWAAHENTILSHIKKQLQTYSNPPKDRDDLIEFINQVTDQGPRTMIDLNKIALRTYYHPQTKGRTSIKKVLPAVMATSDYLKKKYSLPIYGREIASLNFPEGFVWHEEINGSLRDPYERLKTLALEMLGDEAEDVFNAPEDVEIAEGGAAAMAYARLQFEDLNPENRSRIENALLRYCELDTFAMVLIVEAWRDWVLSSAG
jgi:hypothetical protein